MNTSANPVVQLQLAGSAPRCWWCACKLHGEARHVQVEFSSKRYDARVCSAEHEQAVIATYRYVQKFIPLFFICLLASIGLMVGSAVIQPLGWLFALGLFSMGVTIMAFPFVTPQTVEMLGVKRAFLTGRILGGLFVLAALGFSIAIAMR